MCVGVCMCAGGCACVLGCACAWLVGGKTEGEIHARHAICRVYFYSHNYRFNTQQHTGTTHCNNTTYHFLPTISKEVKPTIVVPQVVVYTVGIVAVSICAGGCIIPCIPECGCGWGRFSCDVYDVYDAYDVCILYGMCIMYTMRMMCVYIARDVCVYNVCVVYVQHVNNNVYLGITFPSHTHHTPLVLAVQWYDMQLVVWWSTFYLFHHNIHIPPHPKSHWVCPCMSHPSTCNPC